MPRYGRLEPALAGVGGVLAEPFFQVAQALLQGVDTLLVLQQEGREGRLRGRRHLVPQRSGDRRLERPTFMLHESRHIQQFKS